jgi:hypothetical protein
MKIHWIHQIYTDGWQVGIYINNKFLCIDMWKYSISVEF